jgi:hypothetical protein
MSDTAIVGENIEVIQTRGPRSAFTWSVVFAGALAAWAVSFIFISLGTGIGLSISSPYSGPSAGTMGIAGALWLIFAETVAFATGGYLAARLRIRDHIPGPETKFRDAAHGFMAWVVGAAAMAIALFAAGTFTAKTAADTAGAATGAAASLTVNASDNDSATSPINYYVDRIFRGTPSSAQTANSQPNATTGAGPSQASLSNTQRAEATRIMLNGIRNGSISDADRDYLAQLVSARTGMPQDEAARRVTEVQNQAAEAVKQTADTARKAGAYLSFWSFMALLFGAVAATLAGILGGELRDDYVKV